MKTIKERLARWSLIGAMLTLAAGFFYTPAASAHGEKSQAAFMRMRTILWYDLNWSKETVAVNDTVEISGKFHVYKEWPETVRNPDIAFLNIGIPGPTFVRVESYVGGQLVPRSIQLVLGNDYEFRVVLKARRPGDWHVHTMMNINGGGPVIGPGKWITVTGSMANFKNPITTLTGRTIDMENVGESAIWTWHFLWYAIGIAWIVYWCRGPVFLPRFMMCQAGRGNELISPADKKVGLAFFAGTLILTLVGYNSANSSYPITIPLQAGTLRGIQAMPSQEGNVHVKVNDATYRVPGRAMKMTLTVHNGTDAAVQLGEFMAGGIRFLNADVLVDETGYPENLLAESGLTVSDNSPIAPDETRTITVTASDAAWEIERMSDIIYDPDSRFGGMLFFFDAAGNSSRATVGGSLIPVFM